MGRKPNSQIPIPSRKGRLMEQFKSTGHAVQNFPSNMRCGKVSQFVLLRLNGPAAGVPLRRRSRHNIGRKAKLPVIATLRRQPTLNHD